MIKESDLRLGMKVTVNKASDYYEDWKNVVCTITGLTKRAKDDKINIELEDVEVKANGKINILGCYDGWNNEELDLYKGKN